MQSDGCLLRVAVGCQTKGRGAVLALQPYRTLRRKVLAAQFLDRGHRERSAGGSARADLGFLRIA